MTRPPCGNGARVGRTRRCAITLAETVIAAGVLAVVLLLIAQVGGEFLRQRQRSAARQAGLEAAANILEAARACPWDDLTSDWAARQRLPASLAGRLPEGRLEVRVEPEPAHPHTKRITVEIHWSLTDGRPARPVQLVALRSARSAAGGEP